jgi:hypothetical protein
MLGTLVSAAALGLSSCNDSTCDTCLAPAAVSEVSFGLVAGNFAHNGLSSIVETSIIDTGYAPNPGNLKTYLATGPFTFAAPTLTAAGNNPVYLAAADLNRDGLLDVVSANAQDGALAVFYNRQQSPGTFNAPVLLDSPGASQLAIADVNGDGIPDLISADFNVSVFVQTASGGFASPIPLYSGGANWVAAGDLNHDGSPDVALTDLSGVKVVFHTGAATATSFAAPVQVYTESPNADLFGANLIAIADVNGDGYNDLIITDPGPPGGGAPFVAVLLQNPASPGTFLAAVLYPTAPGSLAQSIQVTDINSDGHPDIIVGGSIAVSVLLNNASNPGTFGTAANYSVPNANEIAIADLNGDGLLDIVTATGATQTPSNGIYTNSPAVLLQSASARGTFLPLQNIP